MERLLAWHKQPRLVAALVIGLVSLLVISTTVYAASYSGWFTAYAMGNQYGGAGVEISQGHFANHYYVWCPNDPSAYWTWGTRITTPSIAQHNSAGQTVYYSTFYLEDVGDPTCSQGNYWVDIYFGRWRRSSESCNCPGVTSPGYCKVASANSCTDATNYGRRWTAYTSP